MKKRNATVARAAWLLGVCMLGLAPAATAFGQATTTAPNTGVGAALLLNVGLMLIALTLLIAGARYLYIIQKSQRSDRYA
jgi:hypothetical protein